MIGESDFRGVLPARRCGAGGRKDSDFDDGSYETAPAAGLASGFHHGHLHSVLQPVERAHSGDETAAGRMPEQPGTLEGAGHAECSHRSPGSAPCSTSAPCQEGNEGIQIESLPHRITAN